MRKIKMLFVSLLAMMLALFCFASCGETGEWKFKSLTTDTFGLTEAKTYNIGDVYSGDTLTENYVVLTVNNDHTFVYMNDNSVSEGAWIKDKENKNTIILYFGSYTVSAKIEKGQLSFTSLTGVDYVLEK